MWELKIKSAYCATPWICLCGRLPGSLKEKKANNKQLYKQNRDFTLVVVWLFTSQIKRIFVWYAASLYSFVFWLLLPPNVTNIYFDNLSLMSAKRWLCKYIIYSFKIFLLLSHLNLTFWHFHLFWHFCIPDLNMECYSPNLKDLNIIWTNSEGNKREQQDFHE